jgi:hypothetical protein
LFAKQTIADIDYSSFDLCTFNLDTWFDKQPVCGKATLGRTKCQLDHSVQLVQKLIKSNVKVGEADEQLPFVIPDRSAL